MDHQTSKTSRIKRIVCLAFCVTSLGFYGFPVYAYTTTNPLDVDLEISASVPLTALNNPDQNPQTQPIPPTPGPINMSDTVNAAIFKGVAYPSARIVLLRSGSVVTESTAFSNGSFEIHLKSLSPGTYTFGIRAEDATKIQSKLITFTVYITSGVTTIVDNIVVPPTITTDKIEVKSASVITFLGQGYPGSQIRVSIIGEGVDIFRTALADAKGNWSYRFDTTNSRLGEYQIKARALLETGMSPFSDTIIFTLGTRDRPRTSSTLSDFRKRCDLNDDNKVNIIDFSIMAFWYKRLGFPDRVDLSSDGKINLTDLSILAYCWTG